MTTNPYIRIAEIEIDPAQIERFKAAAKEEIGNVNPGGAGRVGAVCRGREGQSRSYPGV